MNIKPLKINFVGSFTQGYIGETADEVHLADELENLGHEVVRVPRDIWKAFVDEQPPNADWVLPQKADLNIVCKWHHFNDKKYFDQLRYKSGAKVIYWTWDFMDYVPHTFHFTMSKAADLLLTNEGSRITELNKRGINAYYFPFDVSSKEFGRCGYMDKKHDVVFFGSHLMQGDRIEWLKEINKSHPVTIFAWNPDKWKEEGFTDVHNAVYGVDFAEEVAQSRIILGFNVNDHCWGYWSNRVGKVLSVGGFLLQRYVPGMELFLRDGAEYFSSIEEANEKIEYFLKNDNEREVIAERGYEIGRDRFTSDKRVKELMILIDRYLKGGLH